MKKTLGVISLFVLMSVQILTPIAYAVGDEDFITEATVEETVTEDVVEATDDVEEVSEEVTEEDALEEVSEDKDSSDEDSVEDEVLDEENTETSENNDSESDDVLTGATEEVSEKVPAVLSEEDEAFIVKLSKQSSVAKIAEELGINWYTDSSEYAVLAGIEGNYYGTKEQNNIIREYLIEHAFELLNRSVSEETVEDVPTENVVEEAISEEVELTGLNEEEISGTKYYNGVVVDVLAPAKSFPEGTTLSITPIKKKNELNEIKEQLVDSQEEVTEDSTVVAFDISFLYSGEEVQPVTGQTVQVTFNYENHEKLSDAEQDEEKELKVYHLNDKDEEGNKVENISDVTVEEVEIVKNEEGELVVDAESFSIYTIVTQVAEEGPEALEDQLANFVYGEISIEDPEHSGTGITIMDRNLGAITTGSRDDPTGKSYGYHYQWGNNYGFDYYKTADEIAQSSGAVDVSSITEYSGSIFRVDPLNSWMVESKNLWGEGGQGPCPEGWHVPTSDEWGNLIEFYNGTYTNSGVLGFLTYFNIPFAGLRASYQATVSTQGANAKIWSSTKGNGNYVKHFFASDYSVEYTPSSRDNYGYSVRCFKNTYTPHNQEDLLTITFNFNGGSGSTAAINVVSGEKAIEPYEPVKEGYDFAGWYKEDTYDNEFIFDDEIITGDVELYAKWGDPNVGGYSWHDSCFEFESLGVDDIGNYSVKLIGYDKESCTLENLVIPGLVSKNGKDYFVKKIKGSLFNNTGLSGTLVIGDGVEEIETRAFGNNNFEKVIFPDSLKRVGYSAFQNNTSLKTIDFGQGIESLGYASFMNCGLTGLNFPSSLRNIGSDEEYNGVFEDNINLKTVNFSEGIGVIGGCAFKNTRIESLVFPNSLTLIGNSAFADNPVLNNVVLNEGLKRISNGAFSNDSNLTSFVIPSTVEFLGASLFGSTSITPVAYLEINAKNLMLSSNTFGSLPVRKLVYNGSGNIPSYVFTSFNNLNELIIGGDVSSIGANAFENAQITGLIIPGNVKTIGNSAFYYSSLESLEIETGVLSLGEAVFGINEIESVSIPDSVTSLGTSVFRGGGTIHRLVIGDGVVSIGNCPFGTVEILELGDGITQLDPSKTFCMDSAILKKLKLGNGITLISPGTFSSFKNLEEIEIGNSLTTIQAGVFSGTPKLKKLTLGSSVTAIGTGEFSGAQFSKVDLPTSLTTLGKGAFCSDSVKVPGSIIGVVSGATTEQINSLEEQDSTKCLLLKKDKYTLTYNAGAHSGLVDNQSTMGVVVDYSGTVQLTGNGAKTAVSDKGYTFLGWTDEEGKTTTINSVVVTGDTEVYPVFKQTISATFNGNGNTIGNQKQQVVRKCDRYNNETKCTILNVPDIDQNTYTTTISGYSFNETAGSALAQFGIIILDAATIEGGTTNIEINKDEVLYAQTYKPAVTRTVTYQKGAGNDAKGVLPFTPYNDSCTIAAIYNGNNGVHQATGCELVAPEILVANDYAGYWEGPLYSGDIYTVYENKTLNAYSTGEHYSISFYLDGGTWPTNVTQQDSYQQGDTVVINAPIWTGYTFIGWTTGSNTEPVMNVSIQPTDKGAKLFVAHWQQDEYRIIYSDTVQGTTNLVKTYSYNNGSTLVAPNKSPIGYTFKGWIGENGDTPETSVTIAAGIVGDKYFTAVWEPEIYTVTGHLNGGNILGETSYVFTYDIESGNINLSTPTRDNSTFVGWTGSNGSSPDLNVVISQGSHGDKEYYAVYTCNEGYEANGNTCVLKPYSVTYVLDEGKHTTVDLQETVTRIGTSYKINIKNPIRTGYNFLGWTTNIQNATCKEGETIRSNCRAESVNDLTIEFTEGQAVTLTAKWTHVPIEVRQQDLIGTTPTGIAVVTQYDYENGRVDLAAETMTGYKTKGWSVDTNGVVVYNDQTKEYVKDLAIAYDNPTAVSGGTGRVSLYSVRELINYDIKYLTDEGVHANPLTYNVTQQDIVLSDAEKTGYVFKGWYDVDEKKVETITPETIAELTSPYKLTLTAKWQASKNTKYHVYHERAWIDGNYYKLSGDLTDVDELTGETNTSVIAQRRTNYEGFIMPVDQQTAKIEADGSTEIIYQYEREKNTYKYNTVVGATTAWKRSIDVNYSTDSSTQQMYYQTPIILSGRANTGYSWSGWDVTIGTETTRIEGINENHEHTIIMPLTNVEVTPVVYHIPYTLTYNVNGGTGNESELQEVSPIYYDSGITYPVVTRTGYSFQGWYDDNGTEDKSDDVYYGSGDNANNKKMPNGNLTLTAHWSANPFVLKVNHYQMDLTGNYPAQPTQEVPIDTYIDADITSGNNTDILPETYTGFTLSGDAVESIHINPDGTTKIDYYYIRDKHNVTVNTNEGVTLSGTLSGSYYYQTPVSVEAIINEGYTWSGWNVTSGENEPVFTTDTGVAFILGTGNVILTPLTTTNSYHLTIKNDGTLVFSGDVLYKTNISQYLTTPSKAGYTFNGWSNRPANDLMPAKDLVIEAKWTYKSNGGGGGGGGGSSSSDNKKVIINNTGDKQQEHSSAELTGTNLTGTNKDLKENEVKEEQPEKAITDMNFDELKNLSADKLKKVDRTKLTKEENEILDAYEWAYEHNVTTMVTLNDANPEGVVTRGHLAKMVVNYAINVLGQQLPEKVPSECRWNDWRGDWESDEIKDYAVKACSLGLMGLDMKKFSPKLRVTRAQFGTIMSRLLWGKKYAGGTPYYRKHLNALKENNIMTQIGNPEGRVELRQWVWLMLMRAAMDKNA